MKSKKKEEAQTIERFIGINKQRNSGDDVLHTKVVAREDKFHLLVSNIPDVLWKIDKNNYIVYISENVEVITGYTPEEEYKMGPYLNWIDRVHPDDVKEYIAANDALFETDKTFNIEYRLRKKDGSWVWIHDRAVVTYDEDGKKYASGMLSDITKRKQAELRVRELKEKYETLIRNIPVTVYSALPCETATILFVSDRWYEWTGYTPEECYKDQWAWPAASHPEDRNRAMQAYLKAIRQEKKYDFEYRIVHKETGQVRYVRDLSIPIKDDHGNILRYDGIITDITEQKQLREDLEFYIREITIAQEQERRRISRELHDETAQLLANLYNSINVILMKENLTKGTIERLEQLRSEVDNILEGVRRFSHNLRPALLDQFGLIPSLALLSDEVRSQGVLDCSLNIIGHKQRLSSEKEIILFRITQEALRNTVKHTKATRVTIDVNFVDGRVMLKISDNGQGFEIPGTLSSFARCGKLGLMGMQERINFIDGNLNVCSGKGTGTVITVDIPI
jgi:two-component system sensor histidine kinase DegS